MSQIKILRAATVRERLLARSKFSELLRYAAVVCGMVLMFLGSGCGRRADEPNDTPSFKLTIEPVAADPTLVVVQVTADRKSRWSGLEGEINHDVSRLQSVLSLHVVEDAPKSADAEQPAATERPSQPPILGKYEVEGADLRFRPEFPLLPGQRYVAYFDPAGLDTTAKSTHSPLQSEYRVPKPAPSEPPKIVAIYPSGSIVPANHLKFYLLFSEPMQRGDIFGYFRLDNLTTGKPVPRPFRHTELWSRDQRRLTLWFHPGRQKQGVNLNVEIGPILQKSHEYKLVISGNWASENGTPLGADVEKAFRAAAADRLQPKPETWIASSPRAGTRDTFRCELHEPLDWALLMRRIVVEDPNGKRVAGEIETGYGELSWNFTPANPWRAGTYRLAIDTVLEDLAGNSIERPFEVDLQARPVKPVGKTVSLPFDVVGEDAGVQGTAR